MSEARIVVSAENRAAGVLAGVQTQLRSLEAASARVAAVGRTIFTGFTVGAAATLALAALVKKTVDGVDALNDLKDATGASIENISALEDVALRTGASFNTVSATLVKFNQVLTSAGKDSDAERVLKAIGLSAQELRQIDPAEALRRAAVALSEFADDGNKARIVQELFGKSVQEVAPFLANLANQQSLQAKVTSEQAAQAQAFNQELMALEKNAVDAARSIVKDLVPAFNDLFDRVRKLGGISGTVKAVLGMDELSTQKKELEGYNVELRLLSDRYLALRATTDREPENREANRALAFVEKKIAGIKEKAEASKVALLALAEADAPLPVGAATGDFSRADRQEAKKSAPDVSALKESDKAKDTAKQRESEFRRLSQSIQERINLDKALLTSTKELTDSEKFAISIETKLADSKSKLTKADAEVLRGLLKQEEAGAKALEARQKLKEARDEEIAREEERASAIVQSSLSLAAETQAIEDQAQAIGLNAQQIDALSIAKLQDALRGQQWELAMARQYDETVRLTGPMEENIELLQKQIAARQQLAAAIEQQESDPLAGATRAIKDYLDETSKLGLETARAVRSGLSGLEDVLTDVFSGKKADVKRFIDQIISEVLRLQVIRPLMANLLGGGGGAGGTGGGLLSLLGSVFGGGGGAGMAGLSAADYASAFAKGGVVDSPEYFGYGGGKLGLRGEAGAEGVLPLKRGSDGTLGVQASGLGGASGPQVVQHFHVEAGISRNELMAILPRFGAQVKADVMQSLQRPGSQAGY